jgi:hypothetical protein
VLSEISITVLKHSISLNYTDKEKEELGKMLTYTLGSIVTLLSPLSTLSWSKILHLQEEDINQALEDLHTILDIPKDPTHLFRLHHPSFRDFLLNKDLCGDFWVDEKQAYHTLAAGCIQLMSRALKSN